MRYIPPSPEALSTVLDLQDHEVSDIADCTVREAAFVENYVRTLNGPKASRDAGFSGDQSRRLLSTPRIQEAIQNRRLRMRSGLQVECFDLLRELSSIAFSNLQDHVTWNDEGIVRFIPTDRLSREELAAVRKMKTKVTTRREEEGTMITETTVELEFHSKLDAIKQLREQLGFMQAGQPEGQPVQPHHDLPDFSKWPKDLLEKFEQFLVVNTPTVIESTGEETT